MVLVLRSIVIWLVALPFTLLSCVVLLVLLPLPGRAPRGEHLIRWWAGVLLRLAGIQSHLHGREHIPVEGPCIYVANHQSALDIPLCMALLPGRVRMLAKSTLFYIPVFGWTIQAEGFVPVDRHDRKKAGRSLTPAAELIRQGHRVFIFAEGTRSRTGVPGRFKTGAFRLAVDSGAPIVPLAIIGAERAMPPRSKLVRTGRVEIIAGEPIAPIAGEEANVMALRDRVHRWITETKAAHDREQPSSSSASF